MSSNAALDRLCAAVDASTSSQVDTYINDGIDGDLRHAGEGYHTWRDKLASPWSDYSSGLASARNSNPRDLGGPGNQSCATDLGFDHDDMIAVTQALFDAARRGDPRMDCVREVNGWLGGADPVNIDHELGWQQNYTPDSSHKSHVHIGIYRDVAGNWDAIKGVVDIITGASSGTTTQGGVAVPITSEEDDMPYTEQQLRSFMREEARGAIAEMAAPVDPTTKKEGLLYGRIRGAVTVTMIGLFSGPGKGTLFDRVRQAVGMVTTPQNTAVLQQLDATASTAAAQAVEALPGPDAS